MPNGISSGGGGGGGNYQVGGGGGGGGFGGSFKGPLDGKKKIDEEAETSYFKERCSCRCPCDRRSRCIKEVGMKREVKKDKKNRKCVELTIIEYHPGKHMCEKGHEW